MKKHILISSLFLICSGIRAQIAIPTIDSAKSIVQELISEENIVGLSISVSLKDSLIWSEGFGYADLEAQTLIDPAETQFRIASLSKPITATILGRMSEIGELEFDQSVYTFVPNFPKKKHDITLRNLAMHRSGIRHYRFYESENKKEMSLEDGLKIFSRSRLKFKPGTAYQYSSYGYNLLGVAMEKASGKAFDIILQEYLCEPLNMNHTSVDPGKYDSMQVSGFFRSNGKGKNKLEKPVYLGMKAPSGGLLSTSEDLIKLGNSYIYQRLLSEDTQNEILRNAPLPDSSYTGYAMGWGISKDRQGRVYYSHTGGNSGSVCRIIVYPEEEFCIVILSNTFGIDYLKFIRTMAKISNTFLADIN